MDGLLPSLKYRIVQYLSISYKLLTAVTSFIVLFAEITYHNIKHLLIKTSFSHITAVMKLCGKRFVLGSKKFAK